MTVPLTHRYSPFPPPPRYLSWHRIWNLQTWILRFKGQVGTRERALRYCQTVTREKVSSDNWGNCGSRSCLANAGELKRGTNGTPGVNKCTTRWDGPAFTGTQQLLRSCAEQTHFSAKIQAKKKLFRWMDCRVLLGIRLPPEVHYKYLIFITRPFQKAF